eukprot:gene10318-12030_t
MLRPEIANDNIVLAVLKDKTITTSEELDVFTNNPIYIALVDHSGNPEQMEAIRNGLEALVHALPDNTLFGMILYSHKIGIFNLHCSTPMVKYIDILNTTGEIGFEDIIPLSGFLVEKQRFETNILNAINIIPQIEATIIKKGDVRALGPTIDSLLDYLTFDNITFHVKVGVFMTGCPGYGAGTVSKEYSSLEALYTNYGHADFFKPSTMFYKRQAERAVQIGVHFDLYTIGNRYFGLDTISFLCTLTGGNLYRYPKISPTCSLPQDIVRTSKNFAVDNCFGSILPSKSYDSLYHIESCSQFTSVAFDFKFTDPSAFEGDSKTPFVQIAFSYSYMPPLETNNELADSSERVRNNHRSIERRLHIFTCPVPVAILANEFFSSIDLETTISLLTHKIIKESLEMGIIESRLLLVGWLANIVTKYNENVVIMSSIQSEIDLTFIHVPHLRPLPRYVFALLKSPLLRVLGKDNEESAYSKRSDDWVYCQYVYSTLEPRLLHRAIYPVLYTYGAPNNLASKYLSLSENTILSSISHIYLLDAYEKMVVYYAPQVPASHPYPPPADSLIRQTIINSKQDRLIVPEVVYCRGDLFEAKEFTSRLIEEDNAQGQSFKEFLHSTAAGIKKTLI